MNYVKKNFIFTNNGPYENRGCEAILHGTVELFSTKFEKSHYTNIAHLGNVEFCKRQQVKEYYDEISHKSASLFYKNNVLRFFGAGIKKLVSPKMYYQLAYCEQKEVFKNADMVFSIGGDNYSFDYGYPWPIMYLDSIALDMKKPTVLWGASVGPFNDDNVFNKTIALHMSRFQRIFAREDETVNYLDSIGISENVVRSADPAFMLLPSKINFNISREEIGINLSPLIGRFFPGGMLEWKKFCVNFIRRVAKKYGRKILLIPHVVKAGNDDFLFMKDLLVTLGDKGMISLIPRNYNAAELKAVISKLRIFVGARTHATIAAFSSGVPTLSISYSMKSIGLNKEMYNNLDYCVELEGISVEDMIERIDDLLLRRDQISTLLNESSSKQKELLLSSINTIKYIID